MTVLDTIKERLEAAGQITADLAKRTAEAVRIREQIRQDKKEIRKLTFEIGETYLRLHAEDYEEVYKDFVDGIASAKADIEEKEAALAQLREKPDVVEEDILDADDDDWDDMFDGPAEEAADAVEEVAEAAEEAAETVEEAVADAADELDGPVVVEEEE